MRDPRTTSQRGYGTAHQRLRQQWQQAIDQGGVTCARCGYPIPPEQPRAWDLGHTEDRSGYTGPEHARCNRAAGARKRNRLAAMREQVRQRDW